MNGPGTGDGMPPPHGQTAPLPPAGSGPAAAGDLRAPSPRLLYAGAAAALVALVLWVLLPDGARAVGRLVALQLIGSTEDARALAVERGEVLRTLLFDVALIAAYVLVLHWLVLWAGRYYRLDSVRARRGTVAWAVVAAGLADVLEDLLVLVGVASGYSEGLLSGVWPLAAALGWAKFVMLAGAVGYLVAALAARATTPRELWEVLWGEGRESSHDIRGVLAGEPEQERRKLGISLSGGGIRSASISLGTLQALERPDLPGKPMGWWQAAEVTAISGGSNMAAAWSITRTTRLAGHTTDSGVTFEGHKDAWAWGSDGEETTPEERHLMENLGYLASRTPRGDASDPTSPLQTGDAVPPPVPKWRPSAYATVLSGFLLNAALLLLCLWLVALPLGWFFGWLAALPGGCPRSGDLDTRLGCLAGEPQLVTPTVIWLIVGLVGTVVWVGVGRVSSNRALLTGLRLLSLGGWVLGATMLFVLVLFPYLMLLAGLVQSGNASLLSLLGALGSLGTVVQILRKPVVKYAPVVGGVVFAALVLFLTAYWANSAATRPTLLDGTSPVLDGAWAWAGAGWWVVGLLVLVLLWWLGNPEDWSLAPFYRGKLRLAYATYRIKDVAWPYRNDSGKGYAGKLYEPSFHQYLTRAMEPSRGTPLTVCAACSVSSRGLKTHYGVPAMSTTFTPVRVSMFVPEDDTGKWRSWSCDTESMDRLSRRGNGSRLTTMLAVAISSAAVAPAMGRYRLGPTSMLLTFANIRLGVWMPNPRYVNQVTERSTRLPRIRLGYLFKEFFGIHDPSDPYVYLTDGGHWEITGLVELLRKGDFREVVCVDADPGPGDAVKSISEAIDLAYLETGARVHLDLDPLRARRETSRAPEYSERSVSVGFFESAVGHVGLLWYAKPALTEDMPAALLAHRETHPDFPRISTLDQFFDTSTFVAYRNLGRYNALVIRTARAELLADMEAASQVFEETGRSHGPENAVYADEFDAFCSLEHRGWAATEIAGLICRRTGSSAKRREYWEQIRESLRERAVPAAAPEADGPAVPGQPDGRGRESAPARPTTV